MIETADLPASWTKVELAEIGEWGSGGTPNRKNPAYYGGSIPWLKIGDLTDGPVDQAEAHITDEGLSASAAKLLPPDTLLLAMYGSIGKLGITRIPCATNQAIAFCKPDQRTIDLKYLFFQLRYLRHHLVSLGQGGTQQNISQTILKRMPIALAPYQEQHRIVEKIETLFAQIDKGEEALREVQKLLKRYRQSILKAAVTGSLTGCDWRDLEQVPLGDLLLDIRYGTAKKCGRDSSQTPVLRIPNVVSDEIDLSDLKYAELSDQEYDKLSLRRGDILVVRSNGSANLVARGAIVDENAVGCAYAGYLIRLRIDEARITPQFLKLVLDSPQMRTVIELQARSTSGVHNINSAELKNLSIPLPSLDEQRAVTKRVEKLFADDQSLEAMCESELSRSDSLRQSILKSAFTGQLVPQDPAEEPASELLARIRADREEITAKKRSKKKASRKKSRVKA